MRGGRRVPRHRQRSPETGGPGYERHARRRRQPAAAGTRAQAPQEEAPQEEAPQEETPQEEAPACASREKELKVNSTRRLLLGLGALIAAALLWTAPAQAWEGWHIAEMKPDQTQ